MESTDQTVMNGRSELGRFEPGNQFSKGRSNRAAELRQAFTEAVTVQDVQSIVKTLVRMAGDGDVAAAKLVLDRACGKVDSSPLVAIQNNQQSDDRAGRAIRIAENIIERRRALFTGSGMVPPIELTNAAETT